MGGLITVPGTSFYQGGKHAFEGLLETLGKEVRPARRCRMWGRTALMVATAPSALTSNCARLVHCGFFECAFMPVSGVRDHDVDRAHVRLDLWCRRSTRRGGWRCVVRALAGTTGGIAGLGKGSGSRDASAVTASLVWMTERVSYRTTVSGSSLDDAAKTLTHLWLKALGIAE